MLRDNLVGTVLKLDMTGACNWPDGEQPVLLTKFVGEGAESVVYSIAPLSEPTQDDVVLKLPKTAPYFEMDTLHHSFAVHTELYPEHPLAMSPPDRLEMLKSEMLAKVADPHLVFRIDSYREIIDASISILTMAFADGPVPLDDSPVREWIDDNLVHRATELLDEDLIVEQHRENLECALAEAEAAIVRWRASESYVPVSANPLVMLAGLLFEGFISEQEMSWLARTQELGDRLVPEHLPGVVAAVATMYHRRAGEKVSDRVRRPKRHAPDLVAACDLFAAAGTHFPDHANWCEAMADGWRGRTLLLTGHPLAEVTASLENARAIWLRLGELAEYHDTLRDLAEAHLRNDPDSAAEYLAELRAVRQALGR
ncbi:hypothetical protein [Amycolatopsis alba]|uniref:Uncharacterized protein n=1 Tax=Amycolatopsis alba DSM 44262 TaxID=1125972 RepID=A0A229RVB2_AMYAL|nr:hypothetical protein [Amycolatopsis alba]OXM50419.1 hypothetical protein CFP75_16115 [Amycolatopsis alba DSM 44262]